MKRIRRLLCRLFGHDFSRWKWSGGNYDYSYCARCGIRRDERAG